MGSASFADRLLAWFDVSGRKNLPWQSNPTPYRVWVSEIMLQQTQVATVIPYYERFMARFPDVNALAAAPADEVLHLWTGLGYYARARNLHACAKALVESHRGEFPDTLKEVEALPGIGRSTAAAILALSRGRPHAILDGNVKRVMSRVFGIDGDPTAPATLTRMWTEATRCTPTTRVADYTQAIMDLGATVCTPSRPVCTLCPMSDDCVAAKTGRQAEFPGAKRKLKRKAREATVLLAQVSLNTGRSILLERRAESGVWGGLWSLPQFDSEADALAWCRSQVGEPARAPQMLEPIDHAFTHFDLRLNPLSVHCAATSGVREEPGRLWYTLRSPPRIGLPQPIKALLDRIQTDEELPCRVP